MAEKEVEAVEVLDIERYMGRWYEIAFLPSRFYPKNGVDNRATYTLKPDGTFNVLNETWSDGKWCQINAVVYKADPKTKSDEAKLKIRFWVPPFLPLCPITGDYWVMRIDDDYQFALIGAPSRNSLSILSRQPKLNDKIYDELVEMATKVGYDVSKLYKVPHSDYPPGDEPIPNNTKRPWWLKSLFGN